MSLNSYIDHTLLKPEATKAQIEKLCAEAIEHKFFSVCVNSSYVPLCAKLLKGSSVKVCAVVGFPLGAMDTGSKAFETKKAVENGAAEVDMVIHVGALKDHDMHYLKNDIAAVVSAAGGNKVKVIIETSLLTNDEKVLACQASLDAKAHFVKTSTGFNGGGATIEDIELMKNVVGGHMEIKASGGIKTAEQANQLIKAGATRLGTSSGIALTQGQTSVGGY
jgi:deoxyribose-phosphate aldolase